MSQLICYGCRTPTEEYERIDGEPYCMDCAKAQNDYDG
jgi:hypothetical protein